MYGLENAGIGRYLINLINNLEEIDRDNNYVLLLRKKYFNELNHFRNYKKVLADFSHYTFGEQINLPVLIKKENPDLVHFPHINIPVLYKGKFIVTVHDMTMHYQGISATTLPLYKYLLKRVPYSYAFRQAVLNSAAIITPSKTVKDEIVNYFKINPEKVSVTYEGYSIDYIVGRASAREFDILGKYNIANSDYFFYVGNAYPHKNLERVVKATSDLNKNKGLSVKFVVAGSRDVFMDRLQKVIEANSAQDLVKLVGFVNDDELRVLYKYSLGFVYPSLSEGFGLQGLEAIASGTILLAANTPVFQEIYSSHAFYFNPLDVSSISSTMYSVFGIKKSDKYRYIKTAQDYIKRYSWRKMAEETLKLYQGTLIKG